MKKYESSIVNMEGGVEFSSGIMYSLIELDDGSEIKEIVIPTVLREYFIAGNIVEFWIGVHNGTKWIFAVKLANGKIRKAGAGIIFNRLMLKSFVLALAILIPIGMFSTAGLGSDDAVWAYSIWLALLAPLIWLVARSVNNLTGYNSIS